MMYGNDYGCYNDIAYFEYECSLEEAERYEDDNIPREAMWQEEEMAQIVECLEYMREATPDEYGIYIGYEPGTFTEEDRDEARESLLADLEGLLKYYEGSERRLLREVFDGSEKLYNRYV